MCLINERYFQSHNYLARRFVPLRHWGRAELQHDAGVPVVQSEEEKSMDKDRIKGMGDQAKGTIKDATGKILGDSKLQADGKADKVKGKIENAVGGAKDTVRDAFNK
jgi:uncharacterized protein YjbJ (UPF0337 family)